MGWKEQRRTGTDPQIVVYGNDGGVYFSVMVWPEGSSNYMGIEYIDSLWHLDWANEGHTKYKIIAEDPYCTPKPGVCQPDNKLAIHAKLDSQQRFVHGHEFQFEFGSNRSQSDVDTSPFRQIIGSFVAK